MSDAAPESFEFQAEVNQLLELVIHSLYSNPDIFLRELVSNASDALDRLRFRAHTEPALLETEPTLEIRLRPDAAAGTLTIEDTGVGMTREELVKNLGTIAHSGSRTFLEQLKAAGQKDAQLIGQFGVGFYSAFLVADRVEVFSRAAGADAAWVWRSEAKGAFTLESAEQSWRGSRVVLHLKAEQRGFLEPWRLRELVQRYSDYVGHPIRLEEQKPPPAEAAEGSAPEMSWSTLNTASALWQRSKSEITDAQYEEFYRHLAHDHEAPLVRVHFKAEGAQAYTGLLFVPGRAPFDLGRDSKRGVKLFVKRVFVMEDCEALLPPYLRFVRGVVDSEDLPLNVSREVLQDSAVVRAIRTQLTKKVLERLEKLAQDDAAAYATFWEAFGSVLKEGLAMGAPEHRERLGALLRFESSRGDALVSLPEYVERMPEGQQAIYYVHGESRRAVEQSPHLETLKARGFEVLFLTEPVDAWTVEGLHDFKGKRLVSAQTAELPLEKKAGEDAARDAAASEALSPLLARMGKVLGGRVSQVRASERLTDSPACLVVPEGGPGAYVQRLLKERGKGLPGMPRILEVNPTHPLVDSLQRLQAASDEAPEISEWTELLYEQALLTEGSPLEDPQGFARRVTELLSLVAAQAAAGAPASA